MMATRQFLMAYLSNIELQNWGYISGLLTRPVDRTKPVLGDFVLDGSEQAVSNFYWGVNVERLAVQSYVMEARGTCPKFSAQYG